VLHRIYSRSGIEYRHSVLAEFSDDDRDEHIIFHPSGRYENTPVAQRMQVFEQYAAPLGQQAAEDCLAQLPQLTREDITHVVAFSCTGMYAPGIDIELTERLGLRRSVERTCINFMGCYAAINALKSAYHIARSQPEAVVLLAGVELCSIHYQKSKEPNQVVANALFGDGATAAIVSCKDLKNIADGISLCLQDFYAEFEQSAAGNMVWRIGNAGFDLLLTPEVPHIVRENIEPLIAKLFARNGLKKDDIDYYAIHPGGMRILEACEQALGITKEQNEVSYSVLNDFGNMSSVTVMFVLREYMRRLTQEDKGKTMLACAFGPGITMESMILSVC
jgi:alpha-pyrone synthase